MKKIPTRQVVIKSRHKDTIYRAPGEHKSVMV